MLRRRSDQPSRAAAIAAAACAAVLGLLLLVVWFVESLDAGLNDTTNYRPRPGLALGWAAEVLTVGGIGALVALDIFRRSRPPLWCALGVVAVAAIAVPWRTTDWSLWLDQRRFERISAPAHWDVTAYQAETWAASTGTVGRTFERSFWAFEPESVEPDALLAHYRTELPGHACAITTTGGVVCRSGSEVFSVDVNRGEKPEVVHTVVTKCDNGRDLEGAVDVAALPCGATSRHIDRL